jgi:hypothetical protein
VKDGRLSRPPGLELAHHGADGFGIAAVAAAHQRDVPRLGPVEFDHAQPRIVLPARLPQQRHDGRAQARAHQVHDALQRVQLQELLGPHPQLLQGAVDQPAGVLATVEPDERVALQQGAHRRVGQRARHQQHHGLVVQRGPGQQRRGVAAIAHHDCRVELAGRHARDQVAGLGRADMQVQRRMPCLQRQRGLDQRPHRRDDGAQVHRARHGLRRRCRQQLVVERHQLVHLRQHRAPGLGQHHRLALALEQRPAQLGLERAHLLADGGLGERHARRGRGERSFAGHGQEGAQEAEAGHGPMLKQNFRETKDELALA